MKYKDSMFCILDFETTGLEPTTNYPIEIACLFTDLELNIVKLYNSLIKYDLSILFENKQWKQEYYEAYKVHNIDYDEIYSKGKFAEQVVLELNQICYELKSEYKLSKIILLTDNAYFDFAFMRRLYTLAKQEKAFPFHYSAWDTNLLLEYITDVGDPVPVHRAMIDVLRLYKQLIVAKTRLSKAIIQYMY